VLLMSFTFRPAKRADVSLLIVLAGGTGSGKTESAMRLATGLSAGKPFAVIDTENGRALHKADDYTFEHTELDEPFTPERYAEAVKDAAAFPVIVIDSGSHEYEGIGGVLDIQDDEFKRMGEREGARMSSWIVPKRRHKRFVQELLRTPAHVILCLRAEDKIEIVKQNGKTVVRPKESLIGAEGWIPICEKRLPFEATISLLLLQGNPGVPIPIKLEKRHKPFVNLEAPLDEQTGVALAAWAAGDASLSESVGSAADGGRTPSQSGNAAGSDNAAPLTATEFWARAREAGIARDEIAAVGKKMFPGRSVSVLTDEERGQTWAEVARAATGAVA
jgi:hypothetical protein